MCDCEGEERESGEQQQQCETAVTRDGGGTLEPKGASDAAKEDAVVAAVRTPGRARVAEPSGRENGDWSAIGSGQRRRAKQTTRGGRGGRERARARARQSSVESSETGRAVPARFGVTAGTHVTPGPSPPREKFNAVARGL